MNFTTKVPISKTQFPIDYNSRIMSLGSCFAENMAEKFDYFKFQNVVNPFGIIFNAVSLERLIDRVVHLVDFTENDIFYHNEMWHCFDVHSNLSHPNKEEFLNILNEKLAFSYYKMMAVSHCIITLGTCWVYRNIETKEIVANCHKIPQNQFTKELLSAETVQNSIENIMSLVLSVNKNVQFIFTVSPVRHIKDGFIENNVSKAILLQSVFYALKSEIYNLRTAIYFPSYEILLDELRDYRFYADDMLHPSQQAIDYIWCQFYENYINEKEFATMQQVCYIQKALQHKPFNVNSERHQNFLDNLNQKMNTLAIKYPNFKF